jgi:hypothetical protein
LVGEPSVFIGEIVMRLCELAKTQYTYGSFSFVGM